MTKKMNPDNIPCKFGEHYNDWVPTPFGSGNCAMPGFECTYEGTKTILDICEENNKCPAYEPVPVSICSKHDCEYIGICFDCEDEADARMEEAEQRYDELAAAISSEEMKDD